MEKNYQISVTIHNTYEIDASSKEDAEEKLRDLSNKQILNDCDFNIIDIEELAN